MENNRVLEFRPPSVVKSSNNEPIVTDWEWMLEQARLSSNNVEATLAKWDKNRRKLIGDAKWEYIRAHYEKFRHTHLYQVRPADVLYSIDNGASAFGGTTKDDSRKAGINDASSPAPFALMLHHILERDMRVPMWQDFQNHICKKPQIYLDFICKHKGVDLSIFEGNWTNNPIARGVRYRLATAYNSWIREIHLFSTLRHRYNLPVRHHFMLDMIWKQDIICGNNVLELYVESGYKTRYEGRKIKASEASPLRTIIPHELKIRRDSTSYNKPWLVDERDIKNIAMKLADRSIYRQAG